LPPPQSSSDVHRDPGIRLSSSHAAVVSVQYWGGFGGSGLVQHTAGGPSTQVVPLTPSQNSMPLQKMPS
jgi:hypothetical protein